MKYALTATLFGLAALCLAIVANTPYNPGTPSVVERTISETIYIGSNFGLLLFLGFLAFAAGFAGFVALLVAVDSDKSIRERELDSQDRRLR